MDVILLNVPFSEKDEAKALGAKWNPKIKKWYVTKNADIEKFNKWLSKIDNDPSVTVTAITQENMKEYVKHLFNEFE